jgi:phage shock protein A
MVTGKIDAARREISGNPAVVGATFDSIIEEKQKRIRQYKDAVGAMIAQEEKKRDSLRRQSEDIARLEKLKQGAAAMARKVVERHGGDAEAIKGDPEYVKCQTSFKDFSSALEEKEGRVAELETDISTLHDGIAGHKVQLQSLMRDVEKVQQEKHETIADIITAKEEKEIADMISGISADRTSRELQELRDLRRESKATARVSSELAGLDTKRSEEEFIQYAEASAADDEFDRLIGLAKEAEKPEAEPTDRTRLPEE